MKKHRMNIFRKENGAITVMTAFMLTLLVGFMALSVDFGLHYYSGAKLQNAVDSAATAVAAGLGSADSSLEDKAYEYLAKNGYDRDGKYKDKINVTVERKGYIDYESVDNDEDCISVGYYKITAEVEDSTLFARILDINSMRLKKVAYVRCEADYVGMPDALKYTVFAGSTRGTTSNPALEINGRTGSTINEITASFEGLINNINEIIVQPIIGIFGGEPDYNTLVHINLSEVITNGDVHSNSNIAIGVQALNASRVKDHDFDSGNADYESNEEANNEVTIDNDQEIDDYGQVTYTAVNDIIFTSSLKNNHDDSTHLYVQNRQYLEQTQLALNVIDQIDFSKVGSTASLRSEYSKVAEFYLNQITSTFVSTSQKQAVMDQQENLYYDDSSPNHYRLENQKSIVYNVSQKTAERYLQEVISSGYDALQAEFVQNGIDQVYRYPNNTSDTTLVYQNAADTSNGIDYNIQFTEKDSEEIQNLSVTGTQVNRDITNIFKGTGQIAMKSNTNTGAKYAIARTFQQNSDYIDVPNMKPYFVRQINTSIRNATQNREELDDALSTGDKNVKYAVKTMSDDYQEILNNTDYVDSTYAHLDENGNVSSFKEVEAKERLFEDFKVNESTAGEIDLSTPHTYQTTDWTLGDSKHKDSPSYVSNWTVSNTSFKGFDLYDSNNSLKTPDVFVNEFATKYIETDSKGESTYGKGAVKKYYHNNVIVDSDHNDYTVTDFNKHFGAEAVLKKKNYLKNNVGYNSVKNRFGSFESVAPEVNDVFLRTTGVQKDALNSAVDRIKNKVAEDDLSQGSSSTVSKPTVQNPDFSYFPSTPDPISVSGKTVTVDGVQYNNNEIAKGSIPVSQIITAFTNNHSWNGWAMTVKEDWGKYYDYEMADKFIRYDYAGKKVNYGSGGYHTILIKSDYNSAGRVQYGKTGTKALYKVWYDGDEFYHDSQYDGARGFYVRSATTFLADNYIASGDSKNVVVEGTIIVGGATLKDGCAVKSVANFEIGQNAVAVVNGNVSASGEVKVSDNGILIINGDLYSGSTITIGQNATVIVTGSVTANNKAVSIGNNSGLYIGGKLTYAASSENGKLTVNDGATLVVHNEAGDKRLLVNYDTVLGNGATMYVDNTCQIWSSLTLNDGSAFYAGNLVKYNNSDLNITISSGAKFRAGSITATSVNNQENVVFCCNSLNLSGKFTSTLAYLTGSSIIGDISCYQIKVDGNLTIKSISYIGNMIVSGTLTLEGDATLPDAFIKTNNLQCTGTLTNNYDKLNVLGTLTCVNLVNNRVIYTYSGITVTGSITNNADAIIYSDGKIVVNGNLVNYGKIASTSTGVAITVGGNTDNYSGAIIYTSNGSFTTKDITLNKNSEFSVNGEITITGLLFNNTDLNITGKLLAKKIQNNATIYSNSNIEIEYLKNIEGSSFACNGSLTLTSAIDGKSLFNEGECYVYGDLIASGTVYVDKGILYVYGDLVAANNAASYDIDNALWIENHSAVYINGYIQSNSENMHIWIQGDTNNGSYSGAPTETVLSVYGYHNLASTTSIGNNISAFCNQQEGSNVYLGTGASTSISIANGLIRLTGTEEFENAGSLYVFGNMYLSNATSVKLRNSGGTYISGYFSAYKATVSISSGHEFVCYGEVNVGSISADNGKVFLLGKTNITGSTDLTNGSEFYVSEGSTINVANINCDASTIYLPKQTKAIDFNASFKNNSGLVTESDVIFTANTLVPNGITIYVGGKATIKNGATITNNGKLYLVGSVDLTDAAKGGISVQKYYDAGDVRYEYNYNNSNDAFVFGSSADTYIGVITNNGVTGTYTTNSMFRGEGNVYLENNLEVCGYFGGAGRSKGEEYVDYAIGNRLTSVAVKSGKTHIMGNITINDSATARQDQVKERQGGIKVFTGATLACGGNVDVSTTIYNFGKFYIFGNLTTHNGDYCTDRASGNNMHGGYSLKNGVCDNNSSSADTSGAVMYVGGTSVVDFYGYVRNSGKIYTNGSLNVQGWGTVDGINGDVAYQNFIGAQTHINGYVHLNSNQLLVREKSAFSCNGELKYGGCMYNCGTVVATDDITNNETKGVDTVNNNSYRNSTCKAVINGAYKISYGDYYKCVFKDALIYCGGNMQYGKSHAGGEAGAYLSYGKTYVAGDMLEYTSKGNSFYGVALWLMNDTDTFIGGDCFGGGGIVTGANSIFMCGGDFESKRSTKINIQTMTMYYVDVGDFVTCWDNDNNKRGTKFNYTPAYFYVGGNMFANVLGKTLYNRTDTLSTQVPENCSRDLDIYSNTNMYVGGSMYANTKVYLKENVNLIVAHKKQLSDTTIKFLFDLDSMDPGSFTLESAFNDAVKLITDRGTRSALISLSKAADYFNIGTKYAFYTPNEYNCSILGDVIVNGDGFIGNNATIKDMSKTYFYGDMNCSGYLQLGQALDEKDETEAKEAAYRSPDDFDGDTYQQSRYENAAYMYVGGDLKTSSYTREYASTTLRVKGDFTATSIITGSLELKHDATIYVGKKLKANGFGIENIKIIDIIKGTQDIKNLAYGIRGSSYSHFYVNGSMQSTLSSIIIKDASTVAVNGNMSALRHIRLGEAGDYARTAEVVDAGNTTQHCVNSEGKPCCDQCTDNKDCECGCDSCIWCKAATEECNCCENCTNDEFCECECENCTCVPSTPVNPDETVNGDGEVVDESNTVNTENELARDNSDKAVGGNFYVGGSLASYTGHIQGFAFSRIAVGNYVFTPKYITMRHNADLWVLPEVYDNLTYKYKPYVSSSDGTFLGDLIDKVKEIGHNIKETFKPKTGSVYTLGELTLNRNASVLGTYDCIVLGQCVLRPDSLIYLGHDFSCSAPSVNISLDAIKGDESVVGFDTYGSAGDGYKFTCPNKNTTKHSKKYSMVMEASKYNSSVTYHCDKCGAVIPAANVKKVQVSNPVVVYADNKINISTTVDMKLTYLVANRGDVNLYDIYSKSDNVENNAKELPNAICSYQKNVNYFAMYSKIGALFYAPNGNVDLDGWYMEIWGSVIGDTVDMNTYYLALHRFTNWRTMDLHIPEAGLVYLISEKAFNDAEDNVEDIYLYDPNEEERTGADLFFFERVSG